MNNIQTSVIKVFIDKEQKKNITLKLIKINKNVVYFYPLH